MSSESAGGRAAPAVSVVDEILTGACLSEVVDISLFTIRESDAPGLRGVNMQHVNALAELTTPLPPIVVHRETMTLIDGAHRYRAALRNGADSIAGRFFDGDQAAAFALSVALNGTHGLPLSLDERKAAAERLLTEHAEWSDRRIAALAGLSDKTVAAVRRRLFAAATEGATADTPRSPARPVGSDGVVRPIDCSAGREIAGRMFTADPAASVREVAAAAGISMTTAKDVRRRLRAADDPVPPRQRQRMAPELARRHLRPASRRGCAREVDRDSTIRRLVSDPSVRYSEAGRALLRVLERTALNDQTWETIAAAVPMHCVPAIVSLAENCADDWHRFAVLLEQRAHTESADAQRPPGALA